MFMRDLKAQVYGQTSLKFTEQVGKRWIIILKKFLNCPTSHVYSICIRFNLPQW